MTKLLWLLLALPPRDDAEELFKKFEKKLDEAKSLSVRFKGEVARGDDQKVTYDASIKVKPGEKFLFEMDIKGGFAGRMTFKSDGKKAVSTFDDQKRERDTEAGSTKMIVGMAARTGFSIMTMAWPDKKGSDPKKSPDPKESLPVSDFKISGKEKIGDVEATILEYTISPTEMGEGLKFKMRLWIDAAKLVPLKRTLSFEDSGRQVTATESYEGFSTDEILDKEFEHK